MIDPVMQDLNRHLRDIDRYERRAMAEEHAIETGAEVCLVCLKKDSRTLCPVRRYEGKVPDDLEYCAAFEKKIRIER